MAAVRPHLAGRWLVVANPRPRAGADALREALRRIEAPPARGRGLAPAGSFTRLEFLETRGDGRDVARIASALHGGDGGGDRCEPVSRVIAAGGDGTMRDVIQAIFADAIDPFGPPGPTHQGSRSAQRPSLAILPLGTANNFARALGLESIRRGGSEALQTAIIAAVQGELCDVDLGQCNQQYFAGSLAIGCDADILTRRNGLRSKLGLTGAIGGYPLYLAACALELLRRHGGKAHLEVDSPGGVRLVSATSGSPTVAGSDLRFANLLVTTTPIYAGEFRFVAAPAPLADGALDLHVCRHRGEYLREYATAWRRHVRAARGETVLASRRLRVVHHVDITSSQPLAWQLDGEEQTPTDRFRIRVLPAAVQLHRPCPRG